MFPIRSVVAVASLVLCPLSADAQVHHHHHQNRYTPSYHIDQHNHVVRDSHGHEIGRYNHRVVHQNSRYVLPHSPHSPHGNHQGTYYVENNQYYHVPKTASHQVHRPVAVQFGSFSHVDDLASRLEELSNEFCLDLHYNYSHNPGFRETYAEGYQVFEVAKYIHDAEHQHDRQAIREKLNGLDSLFHHVQDDVRGWSRNHQRQIGHLGIISKMDMIETTLRHLMNDVGVAAAPTLNTAPAPGGGFPQQAPAPLTTAPPPM